MPITADVTGHALEDEVARVYTLLGAKCRTQVLIKGYEIDVAADFPMGPVTIHLLAECKQYSPPKKVSDVDMRAFVVKLLAARECGKADKGTFVTTTGFSKDALVTAERHGIECHTLSQLYSQLVDFTPYVSAVSKEFEATSVANWYVPQTGSDIEDYETLLDPDTNSAVLHKPLTEHIDSLFADGEKRIAVLGNFGTGKSTLCRKYQSLLLTRYLNLTPEVAATAPRLPVLIELRDYRSGIDIHELIVSTLGRRYGIRINVPLCIELQRMGRFVFLLDGLDEMATRVDRTVVNENLREIDRLLTDGDNRYVVTCRTHFFQERVADEFLHGYAVIYLVEWNSSDLEVYLQLRFPKHWKSYFDKIRRSARLRDIARTPQFVEMLIERTGTPAADNEDFGSLELYEGYVMKWIERESRRRGAVMNSAQRLQFAKRLAQRLFIENQPHIHFSNLYELAREFSGYTDVTRLDYFDSDARTCTFITKDGSGNYSFRHRSFMEYFCARIAQAEIAGNAPAILNQRILPAEILAFLAECSFSPTEIDRLHEWSVPSLPRSVECETLARNAAAVLAANHVDLHPEAARRLGIETGTWNALQRSIINGDSEEFSRLVTELQPELKLFAQRYATFLDKNDIEDALQDTFLNLWVRRDRGMPSISDFRSYLFTILRHRLVDRGRLSKRQRVTIDIDEALSIADVRFRTASDLEAKQTLESIRASLTEQEWTILDMLYIQGYSYDEVAKKIGSLPASTKALLYRLRKKLQAHYADKEDAS